MLLFIRIIDNFYVTVSVLSNFFLIVDLAIIDLVRVSISIFGFGIFIGSMILVLIINFI